MPTIEQTPRIERNREQRLRQRAARQGLILRKSRIQNPNVDNHGGYMLVDANHNIIEAGARWDLDLGDVEAYLAS